MQPGGSQLGASRPLTGNRSPLHGPTWALGPPGASHCLADVASQQRIGVGLGVLADCLFIHRLILRLS